MSKDRFIVRIVRLVPKISAGFGLFLAYILGGQAWLLKFLGSEHYVGFAEGFFIAFCVLFIIDQYENEIRGSDDQLKEEK